VRDADLFQENWGAICTTELSRRWEGPMTNPLSRIVLRAAYGASQLPRVAWYVGLGLAMRRLAKAARRQDGEAARQRPHTNAPVPDRRRLYADMAVLLRNDLANVEAGLYPLPADHEIGPDGYLYLLSEKSSTIARLDDLPAGGGTAALLDAWRLGDLDGKPEGLTFTAQGRAIVGLDTRKPRRNLVLLEPAVAPWRGRGQSMS